MSRLIYHNPTGLSGQLSPFDQAILEVAESGVVDIVSPYIGVDYLERIIHIGEEWRLISDVEAWLSSLSLGNPRKAQSLIQRKKTSGAMRFAY